MRPMRSSMRSIRDPIRESIQPRPAANAPSTVTTDTSNGLHSLPNTLSSVSARSLGTGIPSWLVAIS